MSVVGFMLRRALVSVLRGNTLAGDRVHDSNISPIDMLAATSPEPFICLAIEETEAEDFRGDRAIGQSGKRVAEVVIEIGIGRVAHVLVESRDGEPDDEVAVIEMQMADATQEATLDLISRQIERRIVAPGDEGWGRVISGLISKIEKVVTRRGLKADGQERAAFRQIVLTVSLLAEPPIGEDIPELWRHALATLEAEPDATVARLAGAFRAVIIGEDIAAEDLPAAGWGVGPAAARAIQIAPLDNAEERPTLLEAETFFDGASE